MRSQALTNLTDVPISVIVSNKDTLPIRPGGRFELPVVLINQSESSIDWSEATPLNMSYRWLSEDGEMIERDGRRTTIPVTSIPPGSRVEIDIVGVSPEHEGCYELQLSLVLEGVHWACDVGSTGWVQRVTNVTPAPAWPAALKHSRGGRALRGAMVAAELARHLERTTFAEKAAPTNVVKAETVDPNSSLIGERTSFLSPARNWLRALLGVRGLEQQLDSVIAMANSQEQRARELEGQILTFKEELQVDLKLLKDRTPQPGANFGETRYHLDVPFVALEATSPAAAANVSRPPSRLSKGSSKRSKSSGKSAR